MAQSESTYAVQTKVVYSLNTPVNGKASVNSGAATQMTHDAVTPSFSVFRMGQSSRAVFTAVLLHFLQLSLRNRCRCFCCINLSYPSSRLSTEVSKEGRRAACTAKQKFRDFAVPNMLSSNISGNRGTEGNSFFL